MAMPMAMGAHFQLLLFNKLVCSVGISLIILAFAYYLFNKKILGVLAINFFSVIPVLHKI